MMCYKDMTFCEFADCDKFETCPRAYTDEVHKKAIEWSGDTETVLVCFYIDKPECYKED